MDKKIKFVIFGLEKANLATLTTYGSQVNTSQDI